MPTKSHYLEWTVKQLTDEIRKRELTGYSRLNKDGLAQMLADDDKKGKVPVSPRRSVPSARIATPPRRKVVTQPRKIRERPPPAKSAKQISAKYRSMSINELNRELKKAFDNVLYKIDENYERIKMLLNAGADGDPFILSIISMDSPELMKIFIDAGANINTIGRGGMTPLIAAVLENGDGEIVKMLINREANIDMTTDDGNTALIWAVRRGYVKMVDVLIEKGANIDVADHNGMTPIMWAAKRENQEIIEKMLERFVPFGTNLKEISATIVPVYPEIIKMLIVGGADIKLRNNDGKTVRDIYQKKTEFDRMVKEFTPKRLVKAARSSPSRSRSPARLASRSR